MLGIASLLIWLAILLLPWKPWQTTENFDVELIPSQATLVAFERQDVTVLIPARNEAENIRFTLQSLHDQLGVDRIILIDDQSTDETVKTAQSLGLESLSIISGQPLPDDWSGKLWALEQGRQRVTTDWVLLLDADIALQPSTIAQLRVKANHESLDMLSLMAHLRMDSFWEKLLIPSFIYFFKLLYPFKLSNTGHPNVAAAAGGCVLIKRETLDQIGGFQSLKDALIDDCSLAKALRERNKKTWIGLTHSATSHRKYNELSEIWNMVARTAYSQLLYSPFLLVLCTLLMMVGYLIPLFLIIQFNFLGWVIITLMLYSFIPTIKYYKLPFLWLIGLPVSGIFYLLMTWTSAIRYHRGQRSQWKGRIYTSK